MCTNNILILALHGEQFPLSAIMARNLKKSPSVMKIVKVAIPIFGSQVSWRCDCASEILFVEFEDGQVVSRKAVKTEGMNSLQRIKTIAAPGTTMLACGVLPAFYRRMIEACGIKIIQVEGMTVNELIEHLKG